RARGVRARFILVGWSDAGNPSAIPAEQLERWHRQGHVEWCGRREDMPNVYAQSHVVCLPSYGEGVPKTLIEAAACGRPIVTTDVPGCREIVRHGDNGLLVPVRDSAALAEAIRTLVEDRDLRIRMGERGRTIATEEFSVERVVRETLAVYRDLLGAPS
ncbi:MAG TPA: glycosyltransferase, partial [Nitrospiria bacterium]|nr:glycosyltransferase [Nitrospiria bacterium]